MTPLQSSHQRFLVLFLTFAVVAVSTAHGGTAMKPWCSLIDTALVGRNTSSIAAKTHKLCHLACLESPRCESVNYWVRSQMCEMNDGSHFSVSLSYLVRQPGSIYTHTEQVGQYKVQENTTLPCSVNTARLLQHFARLRNTLLSPL